MKMYLKSQYHMDPPQHRAPDGALRQLYPRDVDATTGAPPRCLTVTSWVTPRSSRECADNAPAPEAPVRHPSAGRLAAAAAREESPCSLRLLRPPGPPPAAPRC